MHRGSITEGLAGRNKQRRGLRRNKAPKIASSLDETSTPAASVAMEPSPMRDTRFHVFAVPWLPGACQDIALRRILSVGNAS